MNRRDSAMIAHLDAIEARLTALLTHVLARLDRMDEAIAGLRVDHATHRHEGEE